MSAAKQASVAFHIGGKYNWKNQPERLVYLGRNWSGNGFWHQFAKVEAPAVVWCEVLDDQLPSFEESKEEPMTHPPIKAPFELPQTEMTEAEIIAMAKAHGVDCTMLSSIFEYTRAVERRATLSHPAAQAGAVQAAGWTLPDPKNGYVDVPMYSGDEVREIVASALAATQPSAAPAKAAARLPDPLGCNACTHPDCGRFNGPRSVECRAMADNACARKDAAPGDGQGDCNVYIVHPDDPGLKDLPDGTHVVLQRKLPPATETLTCNKCGYIGPDMFHAGCNYVARSDTSLDVDKPEDQKRLATALAAVRRQQRNVNVWQRLAAPGAAIAAREQESKAQAAINAIAALAPKKEDSIHGPRYRCQQCEYAWMALGGTEGHAMNCAYVIATSVPHTPVASPAAAPTSQPNAAAQEQQAGWMPIATAPKDQVLMLAAEFDRPGDWRMKCGYYTVETGWRVWGASWAPTMWQPMPSAPAPTGMGSVGLPSGRGEEQS